LASGPVAAPTAPENPFASAFEAFERRLIQVEQVLSGVTALAVPLATDVGRVVTTHGAVSADTQLFTDALSTLKGLLGLKD
jgi:hypothetical protein